MIRNLTMTAALTALLGFAVGWFAFSTTNSKPATTATPKAAKTTATPRGAAAVPDASGVVAIMQRFALRPADESAVRETPAVAVAPDGTVVLAWASQAGANDPARTLYLARSTDGGTTFGTPVAWRRVPIYKFKSEKSKMVFSTHVLPRLATTRDGLALGWVEAIDGGPTVRFLVARSSDGGATFSAPVAAHGEHALRPGFTTLRADPEGGLVCGWIDGRNQAQQPFFSFWPAGSEGFAPERLVFDGPDGKGICPCCDVDVAIAPGAGSGSDRTAFVAFRNSDAGHRDIWLARGVVEGETPFAAPISVTRDPWTFDGCPHDGPSLAVAGDRLHVAWMDAHTGVGRVYHAAAPVADPSFRPRALSPQAAGSQGHPRIVADGGGHLHAVWDEGLIPDPPVAAGARAHGHGEHPHQHSAPAAGGGRAIMYAVSRDGGASFTTAHALAPSPGVYQVQPAIALGPDGSVYVSWNESDQDGKHVAFARLARQQPREPRSP